MDFNFIYIIGFILVGAVVYYNFFKKDKTQEDVAYWSQLTWPHVVISNSENDKTFKRRSEYAKAMIKKYNKYGPLQKGVPVLEYMYSSNYGSYGHFIMIIKPKIEKEYEQWDKKVGGSKIANSYWMDLHKQEGWQVENMS